MTIVVTIGALDDFIPLFLSHFSHKETVVTSLAFICGWYIVSINLS